MKKRLSRKISNFIGPKDIKLKPRKKTSHKGQNGRVLVIGGSEDYIGAPTFVGMTSLAVLRGGADLVTIAAPEKVAWAINCISPDLITRKLPGKIIQKKHVKKCLELAKKADVIVLGNGIGLAKETQKFIHAFLKANKKPIIIDADAIKVIKLQEVHNAILTPHIGEYERLLENSRIRVQPPENLGKKLHDNVLVLKGHPISRIVTKTKTTYNRTGNAGMTHGGTGDVLAGIIAALIAQGNEPFMAACTACYVNGEAADFLYKEMKFGYIASDLIKIIPKILKRFQKQA